MQVDPRTRCRNAGKQPQGKGTALHAATLEGCAAPLANNPRCRKSACADASIRHAGKVPQPYIPVCIGARAIALP